MIRSQAADPEGRSREPGEVKERLYELLPAYLRYRDQSDPLDSPLRALMAVLERQYTALERDIEGLYDDWFIETCSDRIAPLLGDLLGVRGLERPESWVPGQRTRIANVLAYRRLKGTTAVLERVARDVTGWACVVSPFFQRLSTSQSLSHVRPDRGSTVDVRDQPALARFDGPFDTLARRPQISGGNGDVPVVNPSAGYNLPNLGLFFWRLQSYPARRVSARKLSPGCYTFSPLGIDQPLFNAWRGGGEITEPATEATLPGPLEREVLTQELAAYRCRMGDGTQPSLDSIGGYFGDPPVIEIIDPRSGSPVPWSAIEIADLSGWRRPQSSAEGISVAVDPELGRLAFDVERSIAGEVLVSYHYGRGGELGGGPYHRPGMVAASDPSLPSNELSSTATGSATGGPADSQARFRELRQALEARPRGAIPAILQIVDSATYGGWADIDLEIALDAGETLEIGAAGGESPTFLGNLRILLEGRGAEPSRLTLEGLAIGGKIAVVHKPKDGHSERRRCELEIRHCTLADPDRALGKPRRAVQGGIEVDPETAERCVVDVCVRSSILGPVAIPSAGGSLLLEDCILDGSTLPALSGAIVQNHAAPVSGCPAKLVRSTVFGRVLAARLGARDSIFTHPVLVEAPHLARASYSYLAPGSTVDGLEKCLPVAGRSLMPAFESRQQGHPGYAQLARRCPREIVVGGSNGSEMGAFGTVGNAFRDNNLAAILDEYMPAGLEPRIFYVT